jgi:hypothetical protein
MTTPPKNKDANTGDLESQRGNRALANPPPALRGVAPEDLRNLVGFFRVLLAWDEESQRTAPNKPKP